MKNSFDEQSGLYALRNDSRHESHPIAILGGRKTGKTTLTASLAKSLIARSHGFPPHMATRFPDAKGLQLLDQLFALKFDAPQMVFRADQSASVRKIKLGLDFTNNSWVWPKPKQASLKGFYQLEIHDLRDDFDLFAHYLDYNGNEHQSDLKPHNLSEVSQKNPLVQFEKSLRNAKSLIICQPADQRLAPSEATGFIRLLSDIGVGRYGEFETIIIAFTKYERLFAKEGVKAFQKATKPETILKIMHQTVLSDPALETGLRALTEQDETKSHLYAMPVSAFGFLRHNGAANFDKLTGQPISALAPRIEQTHLENPLETAKPKLKMAGFTIPLKRKEAEREVFSAPPHPSNFWLPFLTADPFLTAISGIPSQFMVPFENFLAALDGGYPLEEWRKSA